MEDIKSTLYQLLAKTRRLEPKYKYLDNFIHDNKEYFQCELRVHGFDYVAKSGEASSKKAAQTAAAENFCRWLVENGHYPQGAFPQLYPPTEPIEVPAPLEDIKCRLHAVLGKAKWILPEYNYRKRSDGRQYFQCECKVTNPKGAVFVSHCERSQTKKDSQTAAAMKMAMILVENKHFDIEQFPHIEIEKRRLEEEQRQKENEEANLNGFD